jgi:hypothetical protein
MTSNAFRLPIPNVYGGNDDTAPIAIRGSATMANVILDTRSSALTVLPNVDDLTGPRRRQASCAIESSNEGPVQ